MKIKPVKLLVDEALAIVKTITASEVKSMLENPDKNILIDNNFERHINGQL